MRLEIDGVFFILVSFYFRNQHKVTRILHSLRHAHLGWGYSKECSPCTCCAVVYTSADAHPDRDVRVSTIHTCVYMYILYMSEGGGSLMLNEHPLPNGQAEQKHSN